MSVRVLSTVLSIMAEPQRTSDAPCDERSTRIVAESMFRDLKAYGMPNDRIIEIASRLIGLVTSDIKSRPETTEGTTRAL